jgi:hypothetical protein
MRGETEKKSFSIEPISANPRIVLCSVVYRRCIARTSIMYTIIHLKAYYIHVIELLCYNWRFGLITGDFLSTYLMVFLLFGETGVLGEDYRPVAIH